MKWPICHIPRFQHQKPRCLGFVSYPSLECLGFVSAPSLVWQLGIRQKVWWYCQIVGSDVWIWPLCTDILTFYKLSSWYQYTPILHPTNHGSYLPCGCGLEKQNNLPNDTVERVKTDRWLAGVISKSFYWQLNHYRCTALHQKPITPPHIWKFHNSFKLYFSIYPKLANYTYFLKFH